MSKTWLVSLLQELAKIKGVELDISRPNDVAEFLEPVADINDNTKISLYNFLNYLTSTERTSLLAAIRYDMPYLVEHENFNTTYGALARLECSLLNCQDEEILYYIRHIPADIINGKVVKIVEPNMLDGIPLTEFTTDSNNTEVQYLIALINNKELQAERNIFTDLMPQSSDDKYPKVTL